MTERNYLADIEAYKAEQEARPKGNGEGQERREFRPLPTPIDMLRTYEWVIDQFIYDGVMTISGTHGAGKSTALVPLCLAAAGLVEHVDVPVTIHRNVIYFAEDPDQVWRIIHGAVEHQDADIDLIRQRFKVLQAERRHAIEYADLLPLAESMKREAHCPAGLVEVKPLIVFDTSSACIRLESENDNSEVSDAISTIRTVLPGFPVWFSTHQPKSIDRKDITTMSSRGAGAWEADVQGVFYLFIDEDDSTRVLYGDAPVKRRDTGSVREISFTAERFIDQRTDRFGIIQTVPYHVVSMCATTRALREEKAQQEREQAKRNQRAAMQQSILTYLKKVAGRRAQSPHSKDCYATRKMIIEALEDKGLPRDPIRSAIKDMLEEGELVEISTADLDVRLKNGKQWKGEFIDINQA